MSKVYKYYDEDDMKNFSLYFEDSLRMISKKFYSYMPDGNIITHDEYILMKKLLESLTESSKNIGKGSSLLKVKVFNKKLREYYGLEPLDKIDNIKAQKQD